MFIGLWRINTVVDNENMFNMIFGWDDRFLGCIQVLTQHCHDRCDDIQTFLAHCKQNMAISF